MEQETVTYEEVLEKCNEFRKNFGLPPRQSIEFTYLEMIAICNHFQESIDRMLKLSVIT